ncbi:MAG TPA: hypothetical protein VEQ65_04455 [Opitutus sp.]|nr:hypothetical protein [Opitutus sp.]
MKPPFPDSEDEQLRALFQSATPPLPDAGFTERALRRVPPRRPLALPPLLWAAIGAFVGAAVASAAIAFSADSPALNVSANQMLSPVIELVREPACGIALLLTIVSLAATWLVVRQHDPSLRLRRP